VYSTDAVNRLIEAALDQPQPTEALTFALNDVLTGRKHPDREWSCDPKRGRPDAQ
jgi:hypothetical protein